MKRSKILSYIFFAFAILLSDIMCAVTAYNYCDMLWGIQYACYSAPASAAFFLMIPYIAGIMICIILAWIFYKKAQGVKKNKN